LKEVNVSDQSKKIALLLIGKKMGVSARERLSYIAREILLPYQERFLQVLENEMAKKEEDLLVKEACSYALSSKGKRLRPSLVWMVAAALGRERDVDLAAVAVEMFHVSSLIIDDLPCMDDDDFRRGIPSTHRAFSEETAILASFALTAWGFELISQHGVPDAQKEEVLRQGVFRASRAVGLDGLIGGQWLDLSAEKVSREKLYEIVDRKTGVLFELSFLLGWLFGGGSVELSERVMEAAREFGRAFQLVDDLDDLEQDKKAEKRINFALQYGVEETCQRIVDHVERFCSLVTNLGLEQLPLLRLAQAMSQVAKDVSEAAKPLDK